MAFWNKKKTKLDEHEENCNEMLDVLSPDDDDYGKVIDNLKKIKEIKNLEGSNKPSWFNLENILKIIGTVTPFIVAKMILNAQNDPEEPKLWDGKVWSAALHSKR